MIYWIFDMDETLYRIPPGLKFSYNFINHDPELCFLINHLPGIKILFTNGTRPHAITVLARMRLSNSFHLVFDRNYLQTMKPDPVAFKKVCNSLSINPKKDICFFFDDLLHNMKASNQFGWNNIHIDPNYNTVILNHPENYIKHGFPTLKLSLIYYLKRLKSKSNLNFFIASEKKDKKRAIKEKQQNKN